MTTTTLPVPASGPARAHATGTHRDAADHAAQSSPAFALLLVGALHPGVPTPTLPAATAGPASGPGPAGTAAAIAPSRTQATPGQVLPGPVSPATPAPSVPAAPTPEPGVPPAPARAAQAPARAHAPAPPTARSMNPPGHATPHTTTPHTTTQQTTTQHTAPASVPVPPAARHQPDRPAAPSAAQLGAVTAALPAHGPAHISPPAAGQQPNSSLATPAPPAAQPHLAAALGSLRASSGTHQITVQLHPAELGSVQVRARVEHNTLTVTVACADQAARAAVQAALPQLNAQLLATGLGHSTLTVEANGGRPRQNRPGDNDTERERRDRTAARSEGVGGVTRRRGLDELELDRWL